MRSQSSESPRRSNLFDEATGLLYLRARDYDSTTGQFLTVDPLVDQTRQPYAYAGNNPISRTDPTGLAAADVQAFFLGALDGLTGGISSMILEATVPGYDSFIKAHNTAFTSGSVIAQVAVAVVVIVGTAGAGALIVAAKYAVTAGVRTGIKAAVSGVRQVVSGAARLADDAGSVNFFAPLGRSGVTNGAHAAERNAVQAYEVGTFRDLKARSAIGDGLDIHHVPQSHPAQQAIPGYSRADAPSIALPKDEHGAIPVLRGPYSGTAQDLLALDIAQLGRFTNAPQTAIDDLAGLVAKTYPGLF